VKAGLDRLVDSWMHNHAIDNGRDRSWTWLTKNDDARAE